MNKEEKRYLREDITDYQKQNIEEIIRMAYYTFSSYLYSIRTFGYQHEVTNKVRAIWHSFMTNLKEEKKLMSLLLRYAYQIDINEANLFLDDLDNLNEQQILYYYSALDSIDDACETKVAWRSNIRKNITFLSEDRSYKERLCGMLINLDDIKKYMPYPDVFWTYIISRTTFIPYYDEDENIDLGLSLTHDTLGNLTDISLKVPCLTNLANAIVATHYFEESYAYYLKLGTKEEIDIPKEKVKFKEKYLENKYQQLF